MDGVSSQGLPVDEAKRRQRQLRKGRMEMQGYLSILIMVCGASWLFVSSDYLQNTPGFWPTVTMAGGAIWYLAVRIYGIFVR